LNVMREYYNVQKAYSDLHKDFEHRYGLYYWIGEETAGSLLLLNVRRGYSMGLSHSDRELHDKLTDASSAFH